MIINKNKNKKVAIVSIIMIIVIVAAMTACSEEGQFYSNSGRGFEINFPSGWLFEERADNSVAVYKENASYIFIKDITGDIMDTDYEYPLIDRATYAADEFLENISGGNSVGTIDYMLTEDDSGEFVSGTASDTIYINDTEAEFTLTITNVDGRMIADVFAAVNAKNYDEAGKVRESIMKSLKIVN